MPIEKVNATVSRPRWSCIFLYTDAATTIASRPSITNHATGKGSNPWNPWYDEEGHGVAQASASVWNSELHHPAGGFGRFVHGRGNPSLESGLCCDRTMWSSVMSSEVLQHPQPPNRGLRVMLQFEKRQRKLVLVYTKAGCNNLFSPKIMSSRPLFSRVSSSLVAFTFTIAALYGLPLHLLFQLALIRYIFAVKITWLQ